MYLVYKHTNKINNKVYIGITSRTTQERWGKNGSNYSTSPHFFSAIHNGWDNFEHEILFDGLTKEEACVKEKELIKKYKSNDRNFGYNQTDGGECCILNEDARRKKSLAMMGNKNGLGKPCSKEKAKKISEAQKGKIVSEETRRKQSEIAKKKRKHTSCDEETKEKLRNSYPRMRKVYCVETDTIYKSVHECARQLEINATYISAVCRGKYKTAKGLHFEYYN